MSSRSQIRLMPPQLYEQVWRKWHLGSPVQASVFGAQSETGFCGLDQEGKGTHRLPSHALTDCRGFG
jgi:hypothetical protein